MKKFISIISVTLLVFSLSIGFNAYADAWETEPYVIDDNSSSSGLDVVPGTFETEGGDVDMSDLYPDSSSNEDKNTPAPSSKPAAKISISKCSISNIKKKTYTGKKLTQSPTVKYNKTTLKKNTDYTLSYSNNTKVGTATVTVKGKGKYTGSVKKTFKIVPKGTSISKITKPKKKQIKVSYKKQATQTTGYQVQISTSSDFSKKRKTYTVKSNKTTAKTITKLASKKKYYVRVRTFKKVGKTDYYSSWSAYKSVKTK